MQEEKQCIHANCLKLGAHGVLIMGESGTGKSVITLALIDRACWSGKVGKLVSDDYTDLVVHEGQVFGSAPERLRGAMEIRGAGLFAMEYEENVAIDLVVCLGDGAERFPSGQTMTIGNIAVSKLNLPGLDKADAFAICQAIEAVCFRTIWDKSL